MSEKLCIVKYVDSPISRGFVGTRNQCIRLFELMQDMGVSYKTIVGRLGGTTRAVRAKEKLPFVIEELEEGIHLLSKSEYTELDEQLRQEPASE